MNWDRGLNLQRIQYLTSEKNNVYSILPMLYSMIEIVVWTVKWKEQSINKIDEELNWICSAIYKLEITRKHIPMARFKGLAPEWNRCNHQITTPAM